MTKYHATSHPRLVYAWAGEIGDLRAEIERLRAALEPFAEVACWAERNGHDLTKGWDMLLRAPDGSIAGHLGVQSPQFVTAKQALEQKADDNGR